ncbi:DUF2971 domain-containing protein [Rhizobium rhizogenes]|uniref:DUF2971 domain-containing protein n=1 Tax=Rhizobium rhizogenes TaxID=359 RepID=A0AA92C327_RHIRH|nr:DUF2971 domain-containing protein [Rhizobium rhizogenes]PVE54007.1 hypothetical protein DC430_12200 [Rhizobium rhizogenes]PVE66498.1 hypothetical protein DC415_08815 [Agrobacterium tumefaciens]PVE76486.1 hypothetical protein DCP16_08815 [Sphingomonas sp. TPD3009]
MPTTKKKVNPSLNRYTNIVALLHMLRMKEITLLSPATWDDKNDAHFMAEYKRLGGFETLLAVCLSQVSETYHHWHVFAPGPNGVCVKFDRAGLLSAFEGVDGIRQGGVEYEYITKLKVEPWIDASRLPFLKRKPYKPEAEYRVVFQDKEKSLASRAFSFDIGAIDKITLSPWMPKPLRAAVIDTLMSIPGCENLIIKRSTLTENSDWMNITIHSRFT